MNSLAVAFESECQRVAREEKLSMEALIRELAELTEKTPRMLYNYRSGKWPLPGTLIPILCRRFNSDKLRQALKPAPTEEPLLASDPETIQRMMMKILRQVCEHHDSILTAIHQSDQLDQTVMREIEQETERIIQQERTLFSLLEREYEHQANLKRKA